MMQISIRNKSYEVKKKDKGERRILLNALGKQYFLKVFKLLFIHEVP